MPVSTAHLNWNVFAPFGPSAKPWVVSDAETTEPSTRPKKIPDCQLGVSVNDHALLPGPYSTLGAPPATVPVVEISSTRPEIL
jgi:hypothetical protein